MGMSMGLAEDGDRSGVAHGSQALCINFWRNAQRRLPAH